MRRSVEAALVERLADRGDAAIHHVRRRDEVGAGHRVRQRRLRELLDGDVVEDLVALDDAAVAVRGVFAEADVGHHEQVAHLALERAHRGLHRRIGIGRGEPSGSFFSGRPNRITAGTPSAFAAAASLTASSTDS